MNLNFVISVGSQKAILNNDQLDALVKVLLGCEVIQERWVGSGKGNKGSGNEYLQVIAPFQLDDGDLNLRLMSQEQIDAIKFVQKQQEK